MLTTHDRLFFDKYNEVREELENRVRVGQYFLWSPESGVVEVDTMEITHSPSLK